MEFTGAQIHKKDTRDHVILGASSDTKPSTYMSDVAFKMPIFYQGATPSCGGHALAWMLSYLQSLKKGPQKYTPRFNWIEVKKIDGFALKDGTDMRSLFKVAKQAGGLGYDELGNDVTLPLISYSDPSVVTPYMETEAKLNAIDSYAFLPDLSFDEIKSMIYELKAVIALVDYGKEWYKAPNGTYSNLEKDILPLRTVAKPPESHHFVVLHSYDENHIYFANSFGVSWGKEGHGYFGENFDVNIVALGAVDTASHPNLVVPPRYLFSKEMSYGSVGVQVFNLQQRLVAENVATFTIPTGFFGPKTEQSVKNYQVKYGIIPTGYVGQQTLNQLNK